VNALKPKKQTRKRRKKRKRKGELTGHEALRKVIQLTREHVHFKKNERVINGRINPKMKEQSKKKTSKNNAPAIHIRQRGIKKTPCLIHQTLREKKRPKTTRGKEGRREKKNPEKKSTCKKPHAKYQQREVGKYHHPLPGHGSLPVKEKNSMERTSKNGTEGIKEPGGIVIQKGG